MLMRLYCYIHNPSNLTKEDFHNSNDTILSTKILFLIEGRNGFPNKETYNGLYQYAIDILMKENRKQVLSNVMRYLIKQLNNYKDKYIKYINV